MSTKIEWVRNKDGSPGETWNPIVGCSRISEGCRHCYAERMARRLQAMGRPQYEGTVDAHGRWTGLLNRSESTHDLPLRKTKPTVFFVNSMSDLFHESVPYNWLLGVWNVMRQKPEHTFLILTKRADIMASRVPGMVNIYGVLPNVWLGVSIENQAAATTRLPALCRTEAVGRFVSCEPLLGPVDLGLFGVVPGDGYWQVYNRVNWIIAGGESGPDARPMHPDWARALRDQAVEAQVPFFMKQWGEWVPVSTTDGKQVLPFGEYVLPTAGNDGFGFNRVGKHAAGRRLDGREWAEVPEFWR